MLTRPDSTEYAPYYNQYIARVPDGDLFAFLSDQMANYREAMGRTSEEAAARPRREGEWTIKDVIGHVCDGERVFGYRALRFSRGDNKELAGWDQDEYAREAHANSRTLGDLLSEFEHLRRANIVMFRSMTDEATSRTGVANANRVSVRALAYILAGHAEHHLVQLKERFGL
jgi:uncharacterized damage-inducible protein DinB